MTEEQITALIENKRVIDPEKDILDVLNAIKVYEKLEEYKFSSDKSFLKAHHPLISTALDLTTK